MSANLVSVLSILFTLGSCFRLSAPDKFSQETAQAIAVSRSEPEWLKEHRLKALRLYRDLPIEPSPLYSKYIDVVKKIDLSKIDPTADPGSNAVMEAEKFLNRAQEEAIEVHAGSKLVGLVLPNQLAKEGIIFETIEDALRLHHELVFPRLKNRLLSPDEDKFAALNQAFLNFGLFVYVPKGVRVKVPFRSVCVLPEGGMGLLCQQIVVVEEDSELTFIEEVYSSADSQQNTSSLYSGLTEVHVGPNAVFQSSLIQATSKETIVLLNRRASCQQSARVSWASSHLGGSVTRSRLDSIMKEMGSTSQDVEVAFGNGEQRFDLVSDLVHDAPQTTGSVEVRGAMTDKSRSLFKGMIRISKKAINANAYLAEHAILLSKDAKADAIPGLEIDTNEVKATHSASVAPIDEDQIFYLWSRGIPEADARKLIVLGFLEPAVQKVPLPNVRRIFRFMVEQKWSSGSVAAATTIPEDYNAEEVAAPKERDLFERHYKYR